MPLSFPFEWDDEVDEVVVTVELGGVAPTDVTTEVTSAFLKVTGKQRVLAIDLLEDVDHKKARVLYQDGDLVFTLPKLSEERWKTLARNAKDESTKARREASIAKKEEEEKERFEALKKERAEREKVAFDKQWDLDKKERREVEEAFEQEKKAVADEVSSFARDIPATSTSSSTSAHQEREGSRKKKVVFAGDEVEEKGEKEEGNESADVKKVEASAHIVEVEEEEEKTSEEGGVTNARASQPIFEVIDDDKEEEEKKRKERKGVIPTKVVPAPRRRVEVETAFTPKPVNVPARDKTEEEEKPSTEGGHKEKRKAMKGAEEGQSGVWLKEKGDKFFRNGDFAAAVNAYKAALEIDQRNPSLLSNRASAYFKLRRYPEVVDDAGVAIFELGGEGAEEKDKERVAKLYVKRGRAYFEMRMVEKAQEDFASAQRLSPSLPGLADDIHALQLFRSSSLFPKLKGEADALFQAGDYQQARDKYSQAMEVETGSFAAMSNRAATSLALYSKLDDASSARAKELLNSVVVDTSMALSLLSTPTDPTLPPRAVRVLSRRAAAYRALGKLKECVDDLRRAVELKPDDDSLKRDLGGVEFEYSSSLASSSSPPQDGGEVGEGEY
uniref:CS domain-containing protein n=1 Tax=Palpitomonas bilix TaxID=652834 RepID=A0A7S3DFR3_9EUKA|mmetsp:Transcript_35237/g.91522  ORF Transcript_35237/g.91522 Transcript_35237/m.91522 type:complete len:614 (+) Transcript_35237:173-2014(+)|eukprot:CAMPEP_0113879882 /NCGR_PEP_ID=MMETSP0780_2-20120614/7478_1 /TAXON_ID=652834 /ORGANISM="Palpitomonas bilix" /LENGTH=613 /DNA_ID=CAMNT_0000866499 /DNA_START=199 /DNA_END=2040 /DNA_ORIENTATION=- /assembly_acc=CAM_ASM_000599